MQRKDLPDAAAENILRATGCTVTLDEEAIEHFKIELDPGVAHFTAHPPAQAFAMFGDSLAHHTIRLDHESHGGRALFLDNSRYVRNWLQDNFRPGDGIEVRILGPVQFWLRRVPPA